MRYLLLTLVLLAACSTPATQVAATDTSLAKAQAESLVSEAEAFAADAQRQIDQAAAAVAEAERVLAEQQAKERQERLRASRTATTARRAPRPAPVVDGGFWRRLANCENPSGRDGRYLGYFQFSPDTARKVGYYSGASYEAQVAMAQKWLAMIGGRGGSRSGWPVCWWKAGGK